MNFCSCFGSSSSTSGDVLKTLRSLRCERPDLALATDPLEGSGERGRRFLEVKEPAPLDEALSEEYFELTDRTGEGDLRDLLLPPLLSSRSRLRSYASSSLSDRLLRLLLCDRSEDLSRRANRSL
mmetsp:Transcript_49656/g.99647  ORF Transcript_49656/g.99647 Transcript_49656/m.99647 type:complete len:125 (+) Transcript_49656:120-494(+)